MAKYELIVTVEVSDETAAFLDASQMGGTAGAAVNTVRNALRDTPFKRVTVDVAETAQSLAPARAEVSPTYAARKAVKAVRNAPTASTGRTGRPATLHEMAASDGGPVRAAGPRSPEALAELGIETWNVDSVNAPANRAATQSTPKRNTGQRQQPTTVQHKVKVRGK